MEVDIISMSWSFLDRDQSENTSTYSAEERKAFKDLVQKAKTEHGILLFAAANEDLEEDKNFGYYCPANCAGNVFKIGAHESKKGSDFIFPGVNIRLPDEEGNLKPVSGSSIATAFAAGLAGLILYSITASRDCIEEDAEDADQKRTLAQARLDEAKTADGMRKIFHILSGNSLGRQSSEVVVTLENNFSLPVKDRKVEEVLTEFVNSIVPK